MTADPSPASPRERTFRDPAGWVELHDDAVYRFIHPEAQDDLLAFLESPLARSLAEGGRLVGSEVLPVQGDTSAPAGRASGSLLTLRHPRVRFISYPWEWCPAQWLAAATLTLDLCRDLLADGWILKDATPLNVLFRGAEPVFVDVASVARVDLTKPIWYAYGQFVRTFLLPVLAHSSLGWPLRAALLRRDGYEPEELYTALSLQQRLRQPALSAVTLPSMLGRRRGGASTSAGAPVQASSITRDPEVVQHVLRETLSKLARQMRRAVPPARSSTWTSYSHTAPHYSEADHAAKRTFVSRALQQAAPKHVLDVGANAGVYSDFAVDAGASVVAIDTDLHTLDQLQQRLRPTGRPILPLNVDLANPTPGVGWRNKESASFLSRAQGAFDGLVMLAVIHHLLLHDHIPLPAVAELAATLTTRTLIIEWVPPTDVMFRELVRGREAIFGHLTEAAFRGEFSRFFAIQREETLANGRILFHMDKLVA